MSTFPTAFWKADAVPIVDDFTIEWTTSLAGSYGDQPVDKDGFPLTPLVNFVWSTGDSNQSEGDGITSPGFPFKVIDDAGSVELFHSSYSDGRDTLWQGDEDSARTPYFGWCKHGGSWNGGANSLDLSPFHLLDPWVINGFDRPNELHIFFEADVASAVDDVQPWDWTQADERYNAFIQSGNATGTFVISPSQVGKDLVIKVSGLGEDERFLVGAQNYDVMSLYLNRPSVGDDDFICSGCAPMDGRNVMELDWNIDMQQVKLYTGDVYNDAHNLVSDRNIYSPANSDPANETQQDTTASPVGWTEYGIGGSEYLGHKDGSEREEGFIGNGGGWHWGEYLVSGAPRANPSQRVNQDMRTDYTTSEGVGTFTAPNLQLGTHQIKISASTVDGTWQSGAFYGFYFTLVD